MQLKPEKGTTGVFKKEKEGFNPFKMAQQQFDRIADKLNLDEPTQRTFKKSSERIQFCNTN